MVFRIGYVSRIKVEVMITNIHAWSPYQLFFGPIVFRYLQIDKIFVVSLTFVFISVMSFSSYNERKEVPEFCEKLYAENCRSPHLLSLMIEIYEEKVKSNKDLSYVDKALEVFTILRMYRTTANEI